MAKWIMLPAMIECLRKEERHRTDQDLKILFYNLHRIECMSSLTDMTIFQLCREAYYEHHSAHSLLYRRDAVITCWYILLTGSVYIDGAVFVPPNSVGKRTNSSNVHSNDCIVLESTEVIVIYYPDSLLSKRSSDLAVSDGLSSGTAAVGLPSDEVCNTGDVYESDSSAAINELSIESDSEETCNESYCSGVAQDSIHDVLNKCPSARTDEDIDAIVDAVQYLKAFSNMTVATRRAICSLMEYHLVEKSGTVLHNDGDVIETWNVIIHGVVELQLPDGSTREIRDSFGAEPGLEKLIHQGRLCTKVDGCQFLCISKSEINNILHQGFENIQSVEESGHTVLMSEKRTMNDGLKSGSVVIRGTAEKLTSHLVDDHSAVDSSYVEDFLLTYRTFMSSPSLVTSKLIEWFSDISLRNKVIRVVLLWVNNHFRDFEIDSQLSDFLTKFISLLDEQTMEGPCSLLCLTCSSKSHRRSVVVIRTDCTCEWPFDVLLERLSAGYGAAYIDQLNSVAQDFGLRYGDQILEVNGKIVDNLAHNQLFGFLQNCLQKSTRLKLTVRCNFKGLREAVKTGGYVHMSSSLSNFGSAGCTSNSGGVIISDKMTAKRVKSASEQITPKKYKALQPFFRFTLKSDSGNSDNKNGNSHHSTNGILRSSSSDPDLSVHSTHCNDSQFIKIYYSDNCEISLLVNKDVTVKDVIEEAVEKFAIDNIHSSYMLYEICTENGNVRKTRLFDHVNDLGGRFSQDSRLVLEHNAINSMTDSQSVLLQLQSDEVGLQLTENDFELFRNVEPTEFIDDLFDTSQRTCYGTPNLTKFAELANKELFWVVTEVCKELNVSRRAKIIQHFIKIARICQESNNFNSLFAIIGGLGHRSVCRLHHTWDRVPSKYVKMFEGMQKLMDPSRNMSNYRNLLNHQLLVSPAIPFYPLVKKDLTFIRDGNDSKIDDLINFEKLRMMAKEIRRICNMSLSFYHKKSLHGNPASPSVIQDSVPSPSIFSASAGASMFATLRKRKSPSAQQNARKLFEEAQMVQEVKQYLANLLIITNEDELTMLSDRCEPSTSTLLLAAQPMNSSSIGKKRDQSPTTPGVVTKQQATPKFGTESSQAVLKLMSLTDKVRPHDSKKNPLPANPLHSRHVEPIIMHPSAHRLHSTGHFHAMPLSPESSSVTSHSIWHTGQNVASKSSSLDSKQTEILESNRQLQKLSKSHEEYNDIRTTGSRGTSGLSYNGGESLRRPSAPSSAPVSPCHRARGPASQGSTNKTVEDRKLQFPAAAVHSRGQSLDSTYSVVDVPASDDNTTDSRDDKKLSGLRFSRWNWMSEQGDN